jgi:hypothetical protein
MRNPDTDCERETVKVLERVTPALHVVVQEATVVPHLQTAFTVTVPELGFPLQDWLTSVEAAAVSVPPFIRYCVPALAAACMSLLLLMIVATSMHVSNPATSTGATIPNSSADRPPEWA